MKKKSKSKATLAPSPTAVAAVAPTTSSRASTANVGFVRAELSNLLPLYRVIRDAVMGEPAIKGLIALEDWPTSGNNAFSNTTTYSSTPVGYNGGSPNFNTARARRYLPQPNSADTSNENHERFKAYLQRAIFYEVTGRTLEGMCGQIFLRSPDKELPTELQLMEMDADGAGMGLDQLAYQSARLTLAYGRAGILVDYPATNGAVTKAQLDSGTVKPTFAIYEPWNIINWRTTKRGAREILSFVVLREFAEEVLDDGFELKINVQYRVLSLDKDGLYKVDVYVSDDKGKPTIKETFLPVDSKNNRFDEILFQFMGSQNNDIQPDRPPFYGLASVNIGHYRNSADYEESCFMAGQPTLVLAGVTEAWVNGPLKGRVELGSRAAIPLPVNATATIVQASENSMPHEAMLHKETQMVALGAQLVQAQASGKSATGEIIETTSEKSVLSNVADNVSTAFLWGLNIAARFVGVAPTRTEGTGEVPTIKYVIESDFELATMSPDDRNALISEWQSGEVTFQEMRTALRRAGLTSDKRKASEIFTDILAEAKQKIEAGLLPDLKKPNPAVPASRAASSAGGPQPGSPS